MAELTDRLTVVLEAKIDKLQAGIDKAIAKTSGGVKRMQHDIEETNVKWGMLFGKADPGEAIERVFSRSRLGLIEEGATKIPIFGSALEALGPAGLGAAAALAAVGVAAEEARKAMEFADELDRQAKALGVTTTALQEFDYANIALSVGADKGREALTEFNGVLGNYASGLLAAKQSKFFAALGITPEDARNATDVVDKLEKTLLAIARLPTQSQRAGAATKLGLAAFLPVLGEGTEGVEKLIAKMREAQAAGGVIGPADLARAADLNDQLEATQKLVDTEIKSAFIELAPLVLDIAKLIERAAHAGADLARGFQDAVRGAADLASKLPRLPSAPPGVGAAIGKAEGAGLRGAAKALLGPFGGLVDLYDGLQQRGAVLRKADDAAVPKPQSATATNLATPEVDTGAARKALEALKASYDKQNDAAREALQLQSDELAARRGLTDDVGDQATIDAQIADLALQRKELELDKRLKDASYDLMLGKINAAAEKQVEAEVGKARASAETLNVLDKEKIARDATFEQAKKELDYQDRITGLVDEMFQAQSDLALTAKGRRKIALEILAADKRRADARRKEAYEEELAKNPGQATAIKSRYNNEQSAADDAYRGQVGVARRNTAGPGESYINDLQKELANAPEQLKVDALQSLNQGILDAITHAKSLGDAFHDVAQSIIADLIKIGIERAITLPLANALFGDGKAGGSSGFLGSLLSAIPKFATGGVVGGSGGPTSDNVLARLSPGELVVSNAQLRNLTNPRMPTFAPAGGDYTISIDLKGANGDAAIKAAAEEAAYKGASAAIAHTDARFAAVTRRANNTLGRRRG